MVCTRCIAIKFYEEKERNPSRVFEILFLSLHRAAIILNSSRITQVCSYDNVYQTQAASYQRLNKPSESIRQHPASRQITDCQNHNQLQSGKKSPLEKKRKFITSRRHWETFWMQLRSAQRNKCWREPNHQSKWSLIFRNHKLVKFRWN